MVSLSLVCVAIALLGTGSHAHPHHESQISQSSNPVLLFNRALPQWQGFPANDPKIEQLTQAYKDMATIVNTVLNCNLETFRTVFDHYFTSAKTQIVLDVFRAMVQPANVDSSTGADILAAIPIMYNNFAPSGGCINSDPAYTVPGLNGQPSRMHFCQENGMNVYAYPDLSQIRCSNLGNEVSMNMMTLGGSILIHELTHASEVSLHLLRAEHLPAPGVTDDFAYGPMDVRSLRQGLGEFPNMNPAPPAVGNADSYSWFATELYWTIKCKTPGRYFDPPTDNHYTPEGVCETTDDFWCSVRLSSE